MYIQLCGAFSFSSNFRHRQRQQWSQIRSYRRNQEEIKAERRFQLHQELKSTVRQRRERALQDFIRVNLRWVKNIQFQKSASLVVLVCKNQSDQKTGL